MRDKNNFLLTIFSICFIALGVKLFIHQIILGNYYHSKSEKNRTHLIIEHAPRGNIYDCKGKLVATNKSFFIAFYYPFTTKKIKLDRTFSKLNLIDPRLAKKLLEIKNPKISHCLDSNLDRKTAFRLMEAQPNLPGVSVVFEKRRYYPYGETLSHILGYTGEIDKDELKKLRRFGYKMGDVIGKTGIERNFDRFLRGEDGGWLLETDAHGRQIKMIEKIEPKIGNDLYLTIDVELQELAYNSLKRTEKPGVVIAIEPKTGKIKTLVSLPAYDPNLFIKGAYLKMDEPSPLFNRAVQGKYPPGSIFKIIISIAALCEAAIDVDEEFKCRGYLVVGNKRFDCWRERGHKKVSFFKGLYQSCDVYFYNLGLRLGVNSIEKWARKFWLDKLTGIDIPFEQRGFIPDERWKMKYLKEPWFDGDTVNLSIGQGYLLVTPLGLANMICCVANRGDIYRPYLVERVVSKGKVIYSSKPKKITSVSVPNEIWDILIHGLKLVVEKGTGWRCKLPDLEIAGKTGTAQNPFGETHALFVAFAPVDEPKLAIVVIVEHGGMGGVCAAPIAKKIFSKYFFGR